MTKYPRDWWATAPHRRRCNGPGGAHIASQIVPNYEEGAENNILHGAVASEAFLSEIIGALPLPGQRPGAVSPLSCRAEACHLFIALTSFVGAR
jgi:allantoinase